MIGTETSSDRVTGRRFPPAWGIPSLCQFENLLISMALALMMLLPLTESLLRKSFHSGISGSTVFVQHLVLYVGMLGGALAPGRNVCCLLGL